MDLLRGAQRKGHRPEGSCLKAKNRGPTRNQCCQHLDVGLLACRIVRKQTSVFKALVCGVLLWHLEQTDTYAFSVEHSKLTSKP